VKTPANNDTNRVVAYSSPFIPPEWIAAHGLTPSRRMPAGEPGPDPVPPGAGTCPFLRAFVNEACADASVQALVFAATCDPMRRAPDFLPARFARRAWIMHVPSTWQTAGARELYRQELRLLGQFMESIGGKSPSDARLIEVMRRYDRQRTDLLALRKTLPGKRFAELLTGFLAGYPMPPPAASRAHTDRGIPLALLGGPMTQASGSLFDLIDRLGGRVVLDATESGERSLPARFQPSRLAADPKNELARAYFESIPDIFQRPNSRLFAWLKTLLHHRRARGVILVRHLWCDKWSAEVARFRDHLAVPLLDLVLEGPDSIEISSGRVEAFMETCRQ
jgi:benzoyl-CoA reductase/2-hydroxyglutaryl-CoA dehydratase subunit BcrC/BadD/HgdB